MRLALVQQKATSDKAANVARGQLNVRGTIVGTNFSGLVVVDLGPGIVMQKTELKSATEITVRFSVGPEAAVGARTITVFSEGGEAVSSAVLVLITSLLTGS